MKYAQKWGVACWLAVLLCLPWSAAQAGRPIYLSDYLTGWNGGSQWICIPANTSVYDGIEAWEITLDRSTATWQYTYQTGKLIGDTQTFDPAGGHSGIFFSYTVANGITTFNTLIDFDLAALPLEDRQATNKPNPLADPDNVYAIEFSFLMGNKTLDGYDWLGISLQDTSKGDPRTPWILREVQFSSDPSYGGITAFKVRQPDNSIKEFEQFSVIPGPPS
jgi:hypothetical protein